MNSLLFLSCASAAAGVAAEFRQPGAQDRRHEVAAVPRDRRDRLAAFEDLVHLGEPPQSGGGGRPARRP